MWMRRAVVVMEEVGRLVIFQGGGLIGFFLISTIYCACDADSCTLLGKHSIPPRAQGSAAVHPSLAFSPSNLQHYACVSSLPPTPKKKSKAMCSLAYAICMFSGFLSHPPSNEEEEENKQKKSNGYFLVLSPHLAFATFLGFS